MIRPYVSALALCLGLAPGFLQAQPGEFTQHNLLVNGISRSFWLYEPSTRQPGEMLPLVLAQHGGGGTANGFATRTGLIQMAEQEGYVLIAPQGLGAEAAWRHSDDPATMTKKAMREAGDDMAFFAVLHSQVIPQLNVDASRIYGVGLSAGGMMTYRIACQRPGGLTLKAIGVVSTTMTVAPETCDGAGVSVFHIHGSDDTRVDYDGGGGGLFTSVAYPPVEVGLYHFGNENLCARQSQVPGPASDTQEWQAVCPNGTEITLDYVNGGVHGWFDTPSVDATQQITAFFARH